MLKVDIRPLESHERPMFRPLLFLNLAHAYDHFFLLIFPTAVLALAPAWDMSYGEALAFGTAAFVTFGLGTLPAGWLGDRCSSSASGAPRSSPGSPRDP
jgi:hypothetical protein